METSYGFSVACLFVPIAIVLGLMWVWVLIDCAMNEPSEGNDKLVWILVILLANWIGALIYYFVRRPQRIAQYGR